jgi:endonuclease/exonuclease/phosphatase family metal-dependent hydrolase
MWRRTFLAGAAFPVLGLAIAQTPIRPKKTSQVVGQLRPVSKARRTALDQNAHKRPPASLNNLIPEIDDIEVLNTASNAKPRKTLRLIAWNTERGRYWKGGVQLIQETPGLRDPDIIFLGEMDLGMARSSNQHTTREMAAALKMNYAYGVEFLELTGGEAEERVLYPGENEWGYHGNAILSRYPLHNLRLLRFPGIEKWYDGESFGSAISEQPQKRLGGRIALFATLRLGRDVTVVTTHLESSSKDGATRKLQMDMILKELKDYAGSSPILFGGDLNARPDAPIFEAVRLAGFRIAESNDTTGGTNQKVVDGRIVIGASYIDYLLVRGVPVMRDETSPKVILAAYPPRPDGTLLGDHAVVTAKVELPWL